MFLPTIGLEVHIQLKTNTKLFCGCKNSLGMEEKPNFNVCPICFGHPGTLPVLNNSAVDLLIKLALALNCDVPNFTKFDRKNYFYPDLPKGYQISQYDQPLAINGHISLTINNQTTKIRITRLHLEEDAGKLLHESHTDYALIDLNRAGTPLIELVTEPDFHSAIEVKTFCQELQLMVRYLHVGYANMEKGQMRCEANISIAKPGDKLGTKVEVKNLNSFKAVERAIEYEIKRQSEALESDETVILETRGWDDTKGTTYHQRKKEEAHDYRYFPEPDLPPLTDLKEKVERIKTEMCELPIQRRERFVSEYELDYKTAYILTSDKKLSGYTENVISELKAWLLTSGLEEGTTEEMWNKHKKKITKSVANWLTVELFKFFNESGATLESLKITAEDFAEFIILIYKGNVNSTSAKKLFEIMLKTGRDPHHILEENDLTQIDDSAEIDKHIAEVINMNATAIQDYKNGKVNAIHFLVGKVVGLTKGRANPDIVREKIISKINHEHVAS